MTAHSFRTLTAFLAVAGLTVGYARLGALPEIEAGGERLGQLPDSPSQVQALAETPPGALRAAIAQKQAMVAAGLQSSVPNAGSEWQEFGIGTLITDDARYGSVNGLGIGSVSGRVDSFAYDPVNKRVFASIGTGGVWMSTDAGQTWQDIGANLPTLIIGSVAWTPSGGGTVVAGSGEPVGGGFTFVGLGAFWTSDLGVTWNHASGVPDGAMAFRLRVDPGYPDIVYAATSKGLYRSTDAGRSYVNVVLPTICTNLADKSCQLANFVTDVVVKVPGGISSSTVACGASGCPVLAAVGYRAGKRKYLDGKMHSPQNGLYRSDSGAPGTFALLNAYGDGVSSIGFTTAERMGRTALGVVNGPQQNHNYVYAIVEDAVRFNGGVGAVDIPDPGTASPAPTNTYFNGIYVSSDFGTSWIRMADENELAQPQTGSSLTTVSAAASNYAPGIQSWYNLYVEIDPTRVDPTGVPTRLVFGLEEVWTNRAPDVPLNGAGQQGTEDFKVIGTYFAGSSCQFLNTGAPYCPTNDPPTTATTTHPDQHAALWLPDSSGGVDLLVGNDGGVYRQHAVATTGEFDNSRWGKGSNKGFYTLLPYGVGVAKDCTVWFGLQDNGSGRIDPQTRKIYETFGGDGIYAAVDPLDSKVAYTETPGNTLRRTVDGGATWTGMAPSQVTAALFTNPFVMDPTDSKHLLTGGPEIVENLDARAATTGNWVQVFNLGLIPNNSTATQKRSMTTAAVQGAAAYVGYCGLCNAFTTRLNSSQVFGSGIATNVGGSLPQKKGAADGWHFASVRGLPTRFVTGITIDPADPATIYVTLSGYSNAQWLPPGQYLDPNANIGVGHVFKSTNAGEDFVDVSAGLPDLPVFGVTLRGTQLIVSTQIGPFISSDTAGSQWAPMGTGMPNVPVMQTVAGYPGDLTQLYATTYGRGIWRYRFPGERDICPIPAPDFNVAAPVQGAPTNVETAVADPACSIDTNSAFKVNFTYTAPPAGAAPAGYRIEEATRVEEVFYDTADETLSSGSNSLWAGTGTWSSAVNPTSGSMAYYTPDTMDQNDTLTMKQAVAIPPGGALLTFDTTQATEDGFDFAIVEANDDGGPFASVGQGTGVFTGVRQYDLSSHAGHSVKIRFRMSSDMLEGHPGWFVENIRIVDDNFAMLADTPAPATLYAVNGRPNGQRYYRIRGLFASPAGILGGPYSNVKCVKIQVPNNLPVVNAGADFAIDETQRAMLSGIASDSDGQSLSYLWMQTSGPVVALDNADTATPSFNAPSVATDTALGFRLSVSDGIATVTDDIVVTVRNVNLPPVADAGTDLAVDEKTLVRLDGSPSSDPDGEVLTYAWTQLGGPAVSLSGARTSRPSFTAPDLSGDQPVTLRLTVTDPYGLSATDDVVVTVHDLDRIGNNAVGGLPPLTLLLTGLGALMRRRRTKLR